MNSETLQNGELRITRVKCALLVIVASPSLFASVDLCVLDECLSRFLAAGDHSILICLDQPSESLVQTLGCLHVASDPRLRVTLLDNFDFERARGDLRLAGIASDGQAVANRPFVLITDTEKAVPLLGDSALHFFVGPSGGLSRKWRNTVPLIGHGCGGLINILHYLSQTPSPLAITYPEILEFIRGARSYYTKPNTARESLARAQKAADELYTAFPEITAVYGGGFPFTTVQNDDIHDMHAVPPSILRYFDEQLRYFSSRLISGELFAKNKDAPCSVSHAKEHLGLELGRDSFDLWQFTKYRHPPPPQPQEGATLFHQYCANYFEIADTMWPCNHCASLNNRSRIAVHTPPRNFDDDCLGCHQTMFLLRNVMACATDIDIVVTVKGAPLATAQKIHDLMNGHPEWYAYDTDFVRTMKELRGPLDVFVVNEEAFWQTLEGDIAQRADIQARVDSFVVWLPICAHRLKLGANFAIGFEPLLMREPHDQDRLKKVRHDYARNCDYPRLVKQLLDFSVYHKQLLSNEAVVSNIREKLERWRKVSVN